MMEFILYRIKHVGLCIFVIIYNKVIQFNQAYSYSSSDSENPDYIVC